jgi:L-amino acid N-acyltransferase YncA
MREDRDALLEFFRRVPAPDRMLLKDDVTSEAVITQWVEHMGFASVIPLVAVMGSRIIADATLHRRRPAARSHIGEVRVVVDLEHRNLGVGRELLRELIAIARARGLETLMFEVVADREEAARRTALVLGFEQVAVLRAHVRDIDGVPHDLITMQMDVRRTLNLPDEML